VSTTPAKFLPSSTAAATVAQQRIATICLPLTCLIILETSLDRQTAGNAKSVMFNIFYHLIFANAQ
jgi:hypothetical protein